MLTAEQKVLVEEYLPIVPAIVHEMVQMVRPTIMTSDEMISIGNLALCEAAKKKPRDFRAYCAQTIRNAIGKALMKEVNYHGSRASSVFIP